MVDLHVDGLGVAYGDAVVLDGITLAVPSGTTTAILGPSGCGKTTLLRSIAGFIRPSAGTIRLGEQTMAGPRTWVAPERRQIGYVPQDGNLFPHLSVADNITFGLPWRQRRARARVGELLELVGLSPELADRAPDRLSGGQQQRVSLARALAIDPRLVLLDEPFSSLDVALRASTRDAVAAALRATRATAVLVTHDQAEALSFADQVAVMRGGRFAHVGTPVELYRHPADLDTATFVGDATVLPGVVGDARVSCALGRLDYGGDVPDGPADVVVRPEQVLVEPVGASAARPAATGIVEAIDFLGADSLVRVRLADGADVRARLLSTRTLEIGDPVAVRVDEPVLVYPRGDG